MDIEYPGRPKPESRYFGPTHRCPHPERWTSNDGDSTEIQVSQLIGALVTALQPDYVIETGTAWGVTTRRIIKALQGNGHGKLFTLEVDAEPERIAYVKERIPGSPHWEQVICSSLDWEPPLPEGSVGFLFTDTFRDIRLAEIEHFWPWLRNPGAIIAVHDSAWDQGPLRGWIEQNLVNQQKARAIDLPTPRGLTLLEVK